MRIFATIGSFFVVLVLYFLYGWVLVPLVLPTPTEFTPLVTSDNPTNEEIEPFLFLFPEEGWERNPESEIHYLQFGQTIILFGKDEAQGNIVKLQPCTVLMVQGLDDPNLTEAERHECIRQAIVMRTPHYAEIEFDRDFNFGQFPLPNIKAGRLFGKVTIESDQKEIGAQDDLFLETEDISITESPGLTKISTFKDVRFYAGYHYGEGSMLSMELALSNPNLPQSPKELSLVRFEKLKQLNLVFPEDPKSVPKISDKTQQTGLQTGNAKKSLRKFPVVPSGPATLLDIKCQREFIFQFVKAEKPNEKNGIAKFLGNADVRRTNPDGSTDFLTAEEIQVKFQTKDKQSNNTQSVAKNTTTGKSNNFASNNDFGNLEPVSFEANGKLAQNNQPVVPAKLTSQQSGGILMTGDHILYDIRKNLLVLETQTLSGASKEVEMVFQNQYFIRGEKSFQYLLGENGEFGKLISEGKGSLRGNIGNEKTPKKLFLSWNALLVEPYPMVKNQIVLKLWGGITANMEGFGSMTAGKFDLWCNIEPKTVNPNIVDPKTVEPKTKTTPNMLPKLNSDQDTLFGDNNNVTPDRAVVMDKVHFVNEKGTCDVNRLHIFFKTISSTGAVTQSRWTPRMLLDSPPLIPDNQSMVVSHPSATHRQLITWADGVSAIPSTTATSTKTSSVIQQVQFVQPPNAPPNIPPNTSPIVQSKASVNPNQASNQTNQTTTTQTPSGLVPLYQSQPVPPVGTSPTVPVRPNQNQNPNVSGSVASQNFLGIQSQASAQYAITGKQMNMQVVSGDGHSHVEMLAVEGNVRITEKTALEQLPDTTIIEISGEEVTVWHPSSPETQMLIMGKRQDAVFRGRGIELRAKEINIARSSNKIWVPGVGRLIANTDADLTQKYLQTKNTATTNSVETATASNTPVSLVPLKSANSATDTNLNATINADTTANTTVNTKINRDNRLLVDWNENMIFNGKVLQFLGKSDRNGNRVRAIYQDKEVWCDVMEIHLNRLILFFDDKSDVKPEAEMIQCANNVFVRSRELDEQNQLKSLSSAEFGKLRFYVASNYFVAEGPADRPGMLRFTSLNSDEGFSNTKMGLPESLSSHEGGGLKFLSIWFHDHIQGTFIGDMRNVEISGRVQTVYLPVNSWDDHIGIDNLNIARKNGYILECEQLHIVEMPDMNNNQQNTLELTAFGNASIDNSKFYGKARTIKYNQAKTLVTFDGNAKIHTFEEGKKSETAAETIQYDTKSKAIRMNQSQGIQIGGQ
ncbi:MAG: hypothetical protein LBI18_07775 [Planctomycetaceae bacterium]|jgi:lipopolysaccharide export system protein LptA|nr:hypothetical protein [Planctomycetaceae bacterium]